MWLGFNPVVELYSLAGRLNGVYARSVDLCFAGWLSYKTHSLPLPMVCLNHVLPPASPYVHSWKR